MERILVNGSGNNEFIINSYQKPIMENGDYIPSDGESSDSMNVKCKGFVNNISIFLQINTDTYKRVEFSASDIKTLYSKIIQIEDKESYEVWDEY